VTGALWAAIAGLGFGAFQTLNRRAVGGMPDAFVATFYQLVVAFAVLVVATLATEDLGVLGAATALSLVYFSLAGVVHFAAGWTLLNMSQMRIGAARTSPLISTNPVFGVAIAAVTLREIPRLLAVLGIGLVTAGALVVSLERLTDAGWGASWRDSVYGLGTALAWAISPILIREALGGLDSPLVGLTLGMAVAIAAYAALLPFRPRADDRRVSWDAFSFKLVAGVLVGLSTWARWVALESSAVGVVLALGLMSVPVVLLLSPVVMGRHVEQVTAQVWLGATLVVAGSLLLVARG
jgi:drug/metabolite transporter (DMT)-like permease